MPNTTLRTSGPASPYTAPDSARDPVAAPPPAPADGPRHVLALDGIRGLAALSVMVYHFGRLESRAIVEPVLGFVTQFGWAGVDLFFVLSGFLITGILLDSRGRPAISGGSTRGDRSGSSRSTSPSWRCTCT
jgi:hypothetical protein